MKGGKRKPNKRRSAPAHALTGRRDEVSTYKTKHRRVRDARAKATRRAADTPSRTFTKAVVKSRPVKCTEPTNAVHSMEGRDCGPTGWPRRLQVPLRRKSRHHSSQRTQVQQKCLPDPRGNERLPRIWPAHSCLGPGRPRSSRTARSSSS